MSNSEDTTAAAASLYTIPPIDAEKTRLDGQYAMKRTMMGWDAPVPPSIDVTRLKNVLEVGAGTCAWTLDLASLPQIKPHLATPGSTPGEDAVHLSACDIDTKFLPDKTVTDALGIRTFQHDLTVPFLPGMHRKFDLVRAGFLFLCLTEGGWTSALKNCWDVLKPGGMLLIDEADPVLYADEADAPPEGGASFNLEERMRVPGWLGSGNRIYTGFAVENGFLPNLTFRLPEMLHAAGFDMVDTRRVPAPIGSAWHRCNGVSADVANKFADFSAVNVSFVFAYLSAALFAMGKLRHPDGTAIATTKEMEETVHEIGEAFGRDGAFIFGRYCVGVKRDS